MSRDMFTDTQIPSQEAPRTPSMTPLRSGSGRKRASVMNRSLIKESTWRDLWAQYGIGESSDIINNGSLRENSEKRYFEFGKESSSKWRKCVIFLELVFVAVISAFLGALFYAYINNDSMNNAPIANALISNTPINGVPSQNIRSEVIDFLLVENSRLSEELKSLRESLREVKENGVREVTTSSQKGIFEELLTADLVCASNLGRVLATPNTTTVTVPVTITLLWFFSFHFNINHRTPQTTIEGLIQEVGDCWPFRGSHGRLVLKLHRHSLVSGVSISHIPVSASVSGDLSSAPRLFKVLVHQNENDLENGQLLGEFEYKTSGAWRQTFTLDTSNTKERLVDIIEFQFLENHGNPNYTCIYRVHVHGKTP